MSNPPPYTIVDVFKALAPVLLILASILVLIRRPAPAPRPPDGTDARAGQGDAGDEDSADGNGPPLDRIIPALIAVGFYLLGLWRLGTPNEMVFDEVHHARTAMEFVVGQNPHEWTHPHFAKLMMASGMLAWGGHFDPTEGVWQDNATYPARTVIGWRFPSLVFGSLALVVLYALARQLLKSRRAATLATAFLALDGVFFVQSRVAMTNIFTVFFILLASLGVWRYVKEDRARFLALAGFALGGALASRWAALYAWALLLLALLAHHVLTERARSGGFAPARTARWAALVFGGMFVLPAAVYLATYIPYVLQGGGGTYAEKLFTPNHNSHGWIKVLTMQKDMWDYHSGMKDTHPYNSPWWSWPLVLRPVWYYWEGDGTSTRGVWGIGNVFLWWASVPAFLTAGWMAWKRRDPAVALVVLMGMGQWLLWGVKARSLNFMHYMFESIPFACLALAFIFDSVWRNDGVTSIPQTASEPTVKYTDGEDAEGGDEAPPDTARFWTPRRRFVAFYCVLIVAWFVFFYPLLSAYPIPQRFYDIHLWMGRPWV